MQKTALMNTTTVKTRTDYTKLIKTNEPYILGDDSTIVYGADMREHTTFRIGGPADAFIEVTSPEGLVKAIAGARAARIPHFILGGGSNLLIDDCGVSGMVIKNRYKNITVLDPQSLNYLLPSLSPQESETAVFLLAGSGTKLSEIVNFACDNALTGCEFLAGIPGTLGGAVYGNAGAYGKSIGDLLVMAKLINDSSSISCVERDYFNFNYRTSRLKKSGECLLSAIIKLSRGDEKKIKTEVDKIITERHLKHPPEYIGCAGSFFKNVAPVTPNSRRIAAGYFLELAGAKDMKHGNAEVYSKHANFIINPGGATSAEVLNLAKKLKSKVLEKFGLMLEEEVLYIG
ncbi:MAG TPA: UDP-N-acetylmuramate dehydrogenase [Candidatus Wallbacteria bacterium]|nr:MAG: UDP-N-acetylenolpyruvoylglucosamine reductase [bacterium ADurb.Bin243]HOD41225.1 UDP-N-acetylmuramate dehydrogenase [Candidatus Wallbacteria bacterium]HPG56976.1 UDP-N-acetylmuramate dehydrogenase [Candidatus Wallbacteria bacterium]